MAPIEPSNSDIFAALGQLVTVVGSLAETVAQLADGGSGPAAPAAPALPLPVFTQEPGFAPLAALDSENVERRTRLAADLGILAEVSGAELIQWGARGFYRKLDRDEGQERLIVRHDPQRPADLMSVVCTITRYRGDIDDWPAWDVLAERENGEHVTKRLVWLWRARRYARSPRRICRAFTAQERRLRRRELRETVRHPDLTC